MVSDRSDLAQRVWIEEYVDYRDGRHKFGPEREARLRLVNRLFRRFETLAGKDNQPTEKAA